MLYVAAVEPPLPEDQAVRIGIQIKLRAEEQAPLEAPLLKDRIDLGAEDNATAARTHVTAKPSCPSLPTPYLSINMVLEDQVAVEAPLLDRGTEVTWSFPNTSST